MPTRRAPRPEDRGKAAEQTRERILDAAVAEFGAKGYAGARTAGIAARAGVNQQLISYYFGGKQGLLEELRRRWQRVESSIAAPDASFEESIAAYLDATLDHPDWARLAIWQALGDCPFTDAEEGERYAEAQRSRLTEAVEKIRLRQEAGEVTDAIEPEFALLVAYALVFAPIAMPQFVRDILGDDPLAPETRRRLHRQLIKLLGEAED
ncbi:TetR family transcriptional regulator [Actinoallomurus purpureus]|uniref:TetR/AcrR family transcriptional regulator n=1 Tax=Actinoallomurus purpureus TaxID=478114 RepID=UPI002092CBBD|nr:TetR/AcrR family transcriptional regulator [Actinoallomurus purpureus]MCO6009294.1 TetR family transcriptional regulator [Actinoallomurus purpureus]